MKRKRYGTSTKVRRPFKAPRRAVLPRSIGPLRTGGSYNQVMGRYYDGAYRVGGGPERKFIDQQGAFNYNTQTVGAGSSGLSGVPIIEVFNAVVQGTDSITRIGRKIMMTSLQLRYDCNVSLAATGVPPAGLQAGDIRLLVVYDSQTNGAAPIYSDILQATTTGSAFTAPMNLNNRERFKVIFDKIRHLDPQGPASQSFKLYKKCRLPVIFNSGNAGTVADIQTGGVFLMTISTVQATAAAANGGFLWTRVRFRDD